MKYLLWGGSGFIGQALTRELKQQGHICANVTRNIGRDLHQRKSIDNELSGLCFHPEDIKSIADYLKNADGAVFLSAERFTKDFKYSNYLENLRLTANTIEHLEKAELKNAVFLSSIGVYGNKGAPWHENDQKSPENLYALSKVTMEGMVEYSNRKSSSQYKVLRLAQVMGVNERKGYLFNTFLDQALLKNPLTIFGTGKGKRQYIYIKDTVKAVIAALASQNAKGFYNIGCDQSVSISELANLMHELFEIPEEPIYKSFSKEDLNIYEMNLDKAVKEIGFQAEFTVKDALLDLKKTLVHEG